MPRSAPELDILILGPVPPPYGGVSVHIERLVPLLESAGLRVGVLNHYGSTEKPYVLGALKRNPVNYYRLPKRHPTRIVHVHYSRWSTFVAVAIGKGRSRSRYLLTLHVVSVGNQLKSRNPLIRHFTAWALRRFDAFIAVNPNIADVIRDHVEGRPIEVLPAFIRADDAQYSYDPSTEAFLSEGRTALVAAYKVQFLPDGRDLYGLDTTVEAFAEVAGEHQELRLAIFLAERPSGRRATKHWSSLEKRLAKMGLLERVRFFFGLPLAPAFRHDVIFVRPTRMEGDALSVREALQAGVPVLASDAVPRPDRVLTFATDDVGELCRLMRVVLTRVPEDRNRDPSLPTESSSGEQFLEQLLTIYEAQLQASDRRS